MDYYKEKAKRLYELHKKGESVKKVYAVVECDSKYLVLSTPNKKWKYELAGGGVEAGEDSTTAVIREINEELKVYATVTKSLGHITYTSHWNYEGEEFDIVNDAEVFLAKVVAVNEASKLGLDGEFDDSVKVVAITKAELLAGVYELAEGKIKL